ncbi:MAG TPA: DapH/DapD/GlmU-related protein [Abditibacterium sp.]|jgi:putative colanic acid biosynthesis acetyltransferase WcaF
MATSESTSRLTTFEQKDAYTSPWTPQIKARMALWNLVWLLFFRPTPKFLTPWRLFLLRCFGCQTGHKAYVAASAIIKMPWNLELGERACIGDRVEVYNLGKVRLLARSTVAQHTYLCAGSHDLSVPELPLVTGEITIGEDAFVGARSLVLYGVTVGTGAVVGAGAGVYRDVEPWMIVGGNPAKVIKKRAIDEAAWRAKGADLSRYPD